MSDYTGCHPDAAQATPTASCKPLLCSIIQTLLGYLHCSKHNVCCPSHGCAYQPVLLVATPVDSFQHSQVAPANHDLALVLTTNAWSCLKLHTYRKGYSSMTAVVISPFLHYQHQQYVVNVHCTTATRLLPKQSLYCPVCTAGNRWLGARYVCTASCHVPGVQFTCTFSRHCPCYQPSYCSASPAGASWLGGVRLY